MGQGLPSAYLLIGDPFLAAQKSESLLQEIQKNLSGEVAVKNVDLAQTPLGSILTEARTLPFLASGQIFSLQNAQDLEEKSLAVFEQYLSNPPATSFFIFKAAGLEKDHPLAGLILKKGKVYVLDPVEKKSAGARLIREKLTRAGKAIAPSALRRLEEQMAEAPAFLDSLLDQLILYAGDQREIGEPIVEAFEEKWQSTNIFKLVDALASKKREEALVLFERIFQEDDYDWVSLIGLLHWQIRRLWQARVLLDEGASETVIGKKCRLSFKQSTFFMRQVRALSRHKLEEALEGLFQLDWRLKSGRAEERLGIETWILQATS